MTCLHPRARRSLRTEAGAAWEFTSDSGARSVRIVKIPLTSALSPTGPQDSGLLRRGEG